MILTVELAKAIVQVEESCHCYCSRPISPEWDELVKLAKQKIDMDKFKKQERCSVSGGKKL